MTDSIEDKPWLKSVGNAGSQDCSLEDCSRVAWIMQLSMPGSFWSVSLPVTAFLAFFSLETLAVFLLPCCLAACLSSWRSKSVSSDCFIDLVTALDSVWVWSGAASCLDFFLAAFLDIFLSWTPCLLAFDAVLPDFACDLWRLLLLGWGIVCAELLGLCADVRGSASLCFKICWASWSFSSFLLLPSLRLLLLCTARFGDTSTLLFLLALWGALIAWAQGRSSLQVSVDSLLLASFSLLSTQSVASSFSDSASFLGFSGCDSPALLLFCLLTPMLGSGSSILAGESFFLRLVFFFFGSFCLDLSQAIFFSDRCSTAFWTGAAGISSTIVPCVSEWGFDSNALALLLVWRGSASCPQYSLISKTFVSPFIAEVSCSFGLLCCADTIASTFLAASDALCSPSKCWASALIFAFWRDGFVRPGKCGSAWDVSRNSVVAAIFRGGLCDCVAMVLRLLEGLIFPLILAGSSSSGQAVSLFLLLFRPILLALPWESFLALVLDLAETLCLCFCVVLARRVWMPLFSRFLPDLVFRPGVLASWIDCSCSGSDSNDWSASKCWDLF